LCVEFMLHQKAPRTGSCRRKAAEGLTKTGGAALPLRILLFANHAYPNVSIRLRLSLPCIHCIKPACSLPIEHEQPARAQLGSHGYPHAEQTERLYQYQRKAYAHHPHRGKVYDAWHKRIARAAQGARGNYRRAEKRLGKQLYPKRKARARRDRA